MYMKKMSRLKIIQLTVLITLSIITACLLFNKDIKQYIFSTLAASILFVVVWIILIVSFLFLLMDFSVISNIKLNYHNLYEVAYSDPLSGIPNRFSCDVLIEKYIDKVLPNNIGCLMIDLTNLPEINSLYSHAIGNELLKRFSDILSISATSLCFVGRNGGNKFLAIFEDCTQEKLDTFIGRLEAKVAQNNASVKATPIEYRIGSAMNSEENFTQITKLIALANHRVYEE